MDPSGVLSSFQEFERRLLAIENKLGILEKQDGPRIRSISWKERSYEGADPSGTPPGSVSHELAENVTALVGLREAIKAKHPAIKYIWVTLFILGIGATCYYLYRTTEEYLANPTATSIQLADESKHNFFPLMLCPKAWIDTRKALKMNISLDAFKYSLSYPDDPFYGNRPKDTAAAKEEFLSFYNSRGYSSLVDYYSAISPDLAPEEPRRNTTPPSFSCAGCVPGSTVGKAMLDQRMCYVFRLQPVERGFGIYSGVRAAHIRYKDLSLGLIPDSPDWDLYFNRFLDTQVSVHPKITVRSFYLHTIKYDVQKFISLNKPSSPCHEDADDGYSASKCMGECHNEMYRNRLNCSLFWLTFPPSTPNPMDTCNFMDKYPPQDDTLAAFFATEENARIDSVAADVCVKACPPKCEKIIYDMSLQVQEKLPESIIRKLEKENVTEIVVLVKHGAVYQGGMMVFSEMSTYTFTQLVNNIGGTLGLFVGGTVMTLAQLFLFVCSVTLRKSIEGRVMKK